MFTLGFSHDETCSLKAGDHMTDETTAAVIDVKGDDSTKRERSTIEFPYMDLGDAIDVARAIKDSTGTTPCQHDMLAAKLGISMQSSGFRVRLSSAKMFGLIEMGRGEGSATLSPLGRQIVDPARERDAKAHSFLQVELYKKLYDDHLGDTLPPAAALEREMAALGVAAKQTDRARQAFERSADMAGFFEHGRDRLVKPAGSSSSTSDDGENAKKDPPSGGGGGDGDLPPDRLELIKLLVRYLPKDKLSNDELAQWLKAAEVNLRMAYRTQGSIDIAANKPETDQR